MNDQIRQDFPILNNKQQPVVYLDSTPLLKNLIV